MAIDLMGIGNVIGGAGQLLGGLGFGKKDEPPLPPPPAEQLALQREHDRLNFYAKMDLAKIHGLHPLSVLGVPMSNTSPVYASGGGGFDQDYSAVGAGISNIARGFVKPEVAEPNPLEIRAQEANVRLLEAQAKRAEWDALGTEFRVADMAAPPLLMGQPGNPPGARISNDAVQLRNLAAEMSGISPSLISGDAPISMKQEILPPHPTKLGHGAGTDQSMISVMGPDGRPGSVLNQQAIQAEFNEGATMTLLTKLYGVERATEIMAVLEQKGLLGGALAATAAAGKIIYDRLGQQRTEALKHRRQLPGRGRGSWKARGSMRGGD